MVARRATRTGGPAIAFQLLLYPVTDCTGSFPSVSENGEGYLLTQADMAWFTAHYLPDGTDPRLPDASPLFADDLSGLPPALVVTAEFDPLRDEGEAYAEALARAGVEVTAVRYDGLIHGFFSMDAVCDEARRALARPSGPWAGPWRRRARCRPGRPPARTRPPASVRRPPAPRRARPPSPAWRRRWGRRWGRGRGRGRRSCGPSGSWSAARRPGRPGGRR